MIKPDPRLEMLAKLKTETLTSLLAEIFDKGPLMSPMYLAIGMSVEFGGTTTPAQFFELLATTLRTRLE